MSNEAYIGDGVYVSDDGWQLWLAVNHPTNDVVALDPEVCLALIAQMTRVLPASAILEAAKRL